jgi:hypothetical protein
MMQTEITTDEHRFRLRVVESLARLETLAQSTDDHLARLNGSVARHEERLQVLQQSLGQHQIDCPVRGEVEILKTAVLTEQVESRTTSAWWHRLSPLIWLVAGGVIVLFLLHAEELLRVFSKP